MASPDDRRYSDSHEWHKAEGEIVTIGLTKFAIDQLTDVTYVEMQEAGSEIEAGGAVGEVESVKTTSDVYSVVGGEVVEVNEAAAENPALLNEDCYGAGWLVKIKATDLSGLEGLMDAASYDESYAS